MPGAAYLQSSGGIVKDCMIHDIDIANWLMGADETHAVPAEVSAVAYTHHPTLRAIGEHEGVVARTDRVIFGEGKNVPEL